MSDRMDQLVAEAVRQGFKVWQTRRGGWVFSRRGVVITITRTPETGRQWMYALNTLHGAGLKFPPAQ